MNIASDGLLSGFGTVNNVADAGVIEATGGILTLSNAFANGTVIVDAGATLALHGTVANPINAGVLSASAGSLVVGGAMSGNGGFLVQSNATLELVSASGGVAVQHIDPAGDYSVAKFTVAYDGSGTLVTAAAPTPASRNFNCEGQLWTSQTITWSYAASTFAGGSAHPYSGFITDGAEQSVIEQAFQQWQTESGLSFVAVPDSIDTDIRIGWVALHPDFARLDRTAARVDGGAGRRRAGLARGCAIADAGGCRRRPASRLEDGGMNSALRVGSERRLRLLGGHARRVDHFAGGV